MSEREKGWEREREMGEGGRKGERKKERITQTLHFVG